MEQLDEAEQKKIKKVLDARLFGNLIKAGLDADEVQATDRSTRMSKMAEITLMGSDVREEGVKGLLDMTSQWSARG